MSSTIPFHADHDSGIPEKVDGMRRIAGRHAPDSVDDMEVLPQVPCLRNFYGGNEIDWIL